MSIDIDESYRKLIFIIKNRAIISRHIDAPAAGIRRVKRVIIQKVVKWFGLEKTEPLVALTLQSNLQLLVLLLKFCRKQN